MQLVVVEYLLRDQIVPFSLRHCHFHHHWQQHHSSFFVVFWYPPPPPCSLHHNLWAIVPQRIVLSLFVHFLCLFVVSIRSVGCHRRRFCQNCCCPCYPRLSMTCAIVKKGEKKKKFSFLQNNYVLMIFD